MAFDYTYLGRWRNSIAIDVAGSVYYDVRKQRSTHKLIHPTKRIVWVDGLGWLTDAWEMRPCIHLSIPTDKTCWCAGYYYPATKVTRWIGHGCSNPAHVNSNP